MNNPLLDEVNALYNEIDKVIADLVHARLEKDRFKEGLAIYRMEGLMIGVQQDLVCISDYLISEK